MQVCISLQTDNHASTPSPSFLQAGCPSCRPTNSVKALKVEIFHTLVAKICEHAIKLNTVICIWYNNNNDRLMAFDLGQPG